MGERIIETWIQAKHPNQELCEDGLYTGRHYFAVIDGVTSKGSLVWPGEKTGGRFAKDVLLGALETLPADCSAQEAVSCLNHALRSASFQALEHPELLERMREERPGRSCCIQPYAPGGLVLWGLSVYDRRQALSENDGDG